MRPVALVRSVALVCSVALVFLPATTAAATTWSVAVGAGSSGESHADVAPAAPTGIAASCVTLTTKITVSWNAVAHATSYTVQMSTTSSSSGYSPVATGLAGSPWTSGSLAAATYWFEVVGYVGANWASAASAASGSHTITLGLVCL